MATRPIELNEYKEIIMLLLDGFKNTNGSVFRVDLINV